MSTEKAVEKVLIGARYEKLTRLGSGSYGEVWKCTDSQLGRAVAVKLLHRGRKDFSKLKTEGKALSELTHKNIVVVHDLGADRKECWLVMELVDGPNLGTYLQDLVKKGTWLSFEEARDIVQEVLEALEFAHDKGRIHGDIKPANIFLPRTGEAKLGDFGVAKILGGTEPAGEYSAGTERRLGSPTYSAPEVLAGKHRDFQSDMFSVGILAYILLTGQHPFQHKSGLVPIPVLIADETYIPPLPSQVKPGIPEKYEKIVMRLLERDRTKRYQKAREVLDEWRQRSETAPCPVCNAENPLQNKFCGQCGNDLRAGARTETELEKDVSTSYALFTAGRSEEAINLMQNSLKQNPNFAKGWSHLGYMLNSERRYEDAEEACTKSINIDSQQSRPYQSRGFARSNLGNFDGAEEDFTNALENEVDDRRQSQILYQRGYVRRFAGNFEKALEDAELAITLDPENAKAQSLKKSLQAILKKT